MTTDVARGGRHTDWLTIHEASALVGVSSATLRRWCDAGDVKAYTTPGGHRRFERSAVLGMLPAAPVERPTMASLGESADRIRHLYRRDMAQAGEWPAWMSGVTASQRESFREWGREIVVALLDHLDAGGAADARGRLRPAEIASTEYGRTCAQLGASIRDTVELYIRFRSPFLLELGAVARRRGLDVTEATRLLEAATAAFDRLLSAVVTGHAGWTCATGGGPAI